MRLILDTVAERIRSGRFPFEELGQIEVQLGSPPLPLRLDYGLIQPLMGGAPLVLQQPGTVQLAANAYSAGGVLDFGVPAIVSGEVDVEAVPTAPQNLSLGEDWASFALVALFVATTTAYVELGAQYRWRHGDEAASDRWHKTPLFRIRVPNTLTPSEAIPGAVQVAGQHYMAAITRLTGGTATDLDFLDDRSLPTGTVIRIWTDTGESAYRLEAGSEATNAPYVIRVRYFNALTNARLWVRGA